MTETIQTGGYIKRLCTSLEKQMSVAEEALRELNVLSERLGYDSISQEMKAVRVPVPAPTGPRKKVLVVDDIPVNHTLLILQLSKLGVDADVANNGWEAVIACKRQRYSMIFMDIGMPVLNGFEATAEIRKLDESMGIHTPIVAMTAHDSETDQSQCLREGMDDYLTKGGSKTRLREIVNKYVFGKVEPAAKPQVSVVDTRPDASKLDLEWLQDTFGDDSTRVVTVFVGAATTLLNCLELAIANKDLGAVNHFAFSLKGPCSSIGLTAMSRIAFNLSEDAAHDRWIEATDKHKQLREALDSVKSQAMALGDGQFSAASP